MLQLEDDSTDIFAPGIFDRYASRPDSQHFTNMTLAHFAVWYDVDGCDGSVGSGAGQSRSQLQDNLGWVCLRIPVQTVESHGDDYYYSFCFFTFLGGRNPWISYYTTLQQCRLSL